MPQEIFRGEGSDVKRRFKAKTGSSGVGGRENIEQALGSVGCCCCLALMKTVRVPKRRLRARRRVLCINACVLKFNDRTEWLKKNRKKWESVSC